MNQVNSLTSIPHGPIVLVHQATMVANRLHLNLVNEVQYHQQIKNLLFLKSGKIGSCILGYLLAIYAM